jgi:hypothetical protein
VVGSEPVLPLRSIEIRLALATKLCMNMLGGTRGVKESGLCQRKAEHRNQGKESRTQSRTSRSGRKSRKIAHHIKLQVLSLDEVKTSVSLHTGARLFLGSVGIVQVQVQG